MRKSLWIIFAVMVVAVSAPNAHADDVTVDVSATMLPDSFFGASCSPSCLLGGTIVFDNVTGDITSEDVTFTGESPTVGPFTQNFALGSEPDGSVLIQILDAGGDLLALLILDPNTPGSLIGYTGGPLNDATIEFPVSGIPWTCVSNTSPPVACSGSLTPTVAVGTPEPSSLALMLAGIGLVLVMRKQD